jgi:hypothetical protein
MQTIPMLRDDAGKGAAGATSPRTCWAAYRSMRNYEQLIPHLEFRGDRGGDVERYREG